MRAGWLTGAALAAASVLGPLASHAAAPSALFVENQGQYPAHVRYAVSANPTASPEGLQLLWAQADTLWLTLPASAEERMAFRVHLQHTAGQLDIHPGGDDGPTMSWYRGADPERWITGVRTHNAIVFTTPAHTARLTLQMSADGLYLHTTGLPGFTLRVDDIAVTLTETGAGGGDAHPLLLTSPDQQAARLPMHIEGHAIRVLGADATGQAVDVLLDAMPVHDVALTRTRAPAAALPKGPAADPLNIAYSSFIGSTLADEAEATAFANGDVFLAGHTQSLTFPAMPGRAASANPHVVNAFVARIVPSAPANGYITVFQGSDLADGEEYGFAMTADDAGNVFVAGNTNSDDFPVTAGAYATAYSGNIDAYVARLNSNGSLNYATFLGGDDFDSVYGLAVDDAGQVHVAGGSWSSDFPTTSNALNTTNQGERDAFISILNASGNTLLYSTYVGGSSQEQAEAVAVDALGRVHIAGWTRSADLGVPVVAPADGARALASPFDGFAARIDPTGTDRDYVVTLGGTDEDRADTLVLDNQARAILSGRTASDDFPITAGAFDPTYGGGICTFAPCPDAFIAKLTNDASDLVFASYHGGSSWDEGRALALDPDGNILLAGMTESLDMPLLDALDNTQDGFNDAFLMQINPQGTTLQFSSYLGGENEDEANALQVDALGRIHVAGRTRSDDFPTTPDAFANTLAGDYDAYTLVLSGDAADGDADGVADASDNCTEVNNPDQQDSNNDGFGNACDADLNGDCTINFLDLSAMKAVFFSNDPDANLNGDDTVNFLDLSLMKARFFQAPGPSALSDCG